MFKKGIATAAIAGMLLSLAGMAHAEGSHNFDPLVDVFRYLSIVMFVMLGQAIYLLCVARRTWGRKIMWVFALTVVNVIGIALVVMTYMSKVIDLDNPIGLFLMVIPGLMFLSFVHSHVTREKISSPPKSD